MRQIHLEAVYYGRMTRDNSPDYPLGDFSASSLGTYFPCLVNKDAISTSRLLLHCPMKHVGHRLTTTVAAGIHTDVTRIGQVERPCYGFQSEKPS